MHLNRHCGDYVRTCVVADIPRNADEDVLSIRIPKLWLLIGGVFLVLAIRSHFSKPALRPGWTRIVINHIDAAHPNGRSETLDVPPGSPGAELAHLGHVQGKEKP